MREKILKILDYGKIIISPKKKIKWQYLILSHIFYSLILIVIILVFAITNDQWGPTSKEDKKLIIKYDDIIDNGHHAGSYRIQGWYESKQIISANKEIEVDISYLDYTFDKHYFKSELGIFNLPDNINASVCPENAVDVNDLKKKSCINVILKKEDLGGFISYINNSLIKKDMQFLTSGKQLVTISPEGLLQIHVKDVFEIEPTYVNAELQLNKYVFMLTLAGIMAVILQIFDFGLKIYDRLGKLQK